MFFDHPVFSPPFPCFTCMEILFWVVAFVAGVLGTIAAFGISSILLPVALSSFNYETALILVSLFHISGNIGRISFFNRNPDKQLIKFFGIPAVICTFAGASLVGSIDESILRVLLGLILLIYSGLGLLNHKLSFKPTRTNSIIGGSVYGFLSGLVGTGGPLRGAILLGFGLERELYIATSGVVSFMIDLTRIPVYLWKGFLQPEYYAYLPFLLIVALAGSYFSKLIVEKVPVKQFTKIVQLSILLISIKLVIEGLLTLV
jgi:uncharacterized membrane protein YfcA